MLSNQEKNKMKLTKNNIKDGHINYKLYFYVHKYLSTLLFHDNSTQCFTHLIYYIFYVGTITAISVI